MTPTQATQTHPPLFEGLPDDVMAREFGRWLAERRASLQRADRAALTSELAMYQELDRRLQSHMNVIAAQAYQGKHPKHWLWRSHKQYILDRVRPGEKVLDVGCGASAYLLWMAEKGCKVTAIDNRREVVELAQSIMSHPNLRFAHRDIVKDPPDEAYDVVICSHVIEHIDEPAPLLAALRTWAPRLIVAVPPNDNRWQKLMFRELGLPWKDDEDHRREYTPALLREQVTAAGWRITDLHAGVDIKAVALNPDARPAPLSFIPAAASADANLALQRERSLGKKSYDSMVRSGYLAQRLAAEIRAAGMTDARVLCVGARNRCELDCLESAGLHQPLGIDLHSTDPRIQVMDMHRLDFPDGSFDALFSSHSFEHAMDPAQVAAEMRRVLRPGGLIVMEVPTGYDPTGVDLWDFRSAENVRAYFEPCELLWSETGPQLDAAHQQVIRILMKLRD